MGKRRESTQSTRLKEDSADETNSPVSSHKKHKKHKKKHRKKESTVEENAIVGEQEDMAGSPKGSIKLKLKIGTETLGTKNVVTVKQEPTDSFINVTDDQWEEGDAFDPNEKTKKAGEDTSDEEKEWLTALEKGELDDYGEVSKGTKDPSLMTARQRALKHGTQEQELLQLPTGYRQVELTEEQLKRREQRAHKRKQKAHEKREKDKRQTIDRLLKKQESKKSKISKRKTDSPKVTYVNNAGGISISVPEGVDFPFPAQGATSPNPAKSKCSISGCLNIKKYACSKTGVSLCSLPCYKKNLVLHRLSQPGMVTT